MLKEINKELIFIDYNWCRMVFVSLLHSREEYFDEGLVPKNFRNYPTRNH